MIKKITLVVFTIILIFTSYYSISESNGPSGGYTNAPSDYGNCTSCHTGSIITSGTTGSNFSNISMSMKLTSTGASSSNYQPGKTYTITIAYSQSGISKWGFQATILDASNNKVGSISSTSSRTRLTTAKSREYIEHGSGGTSSTSTNTTDWSFSWTAPSTNVGAVKLYMCLNVANNDNNYTGDQIYAKSFTINPVSAMVVDARCNDSVTCAGNTVTLIGTSTGSPSKWSWITKGGIPSISSSQYPDIKYNNAGTFYAILRAINSTDTSKADTVKIVVNPKPSATLNNASNYTICKGDSIKLECTSANVKYYWSPIGTTTASVWVKDTGTYFVTTTNTGNCSNTSTKVKIDQFPSYKISISRDVTNDTICYNRPIKLTASETTKTFTFDSILYYNSSGLIQANSINPQNLYFTASSDLFAKGKDSNGCLTAPSNKFNFVVKKGVNTPTANCVNKTTSSFEISWNVVSNSKGYKVSIDSGKTWQNPTGGLTHKVLGFPGNTDVLVLLKALDVFPCNESEITKVICGTSPCSPISYNLVWDKDVCKLSNINFKIRDLNTSKYSFKINGIGSYKDTAFKIVADSSRTYHFELIDSSNLTCPTIKRDALVKVWEIPSLILSSSSAQNIFCEGSPAAFDVVSKNMQEYNFFVNNVSKQKSNSPVWNYAAPMNMDSVWVIVTNGSCVSNSKKLKLNVKPLPLATFTYSFSGNTATFTPDKTGNVKYKWTFGDGGTDSVSTKPIHNYTIKGNVWVKLTVIDEFGCMKTDSSQIEVPSSVNKTFNESGIKVYPQPAKNNLIVEVGSELLNAKILLTDLTGKVLIQTIADKNATELNTYYFTNGIYLLKLEKDGSIINGKVIINH